MYEITITRVTPALKGRWFGASAPTETTLYFQRVAQLDIAAVIASVNQAEYELTAAGLTYSDRPNLDEICPSVPEVTDDRDL